MIAQNTAPEPSGTAYIAGANLVVDLSAYLSNTPLTLISAPPLHLVGTFGSRKFLGGRSATVNYDIANGKVFLNNFHLGAGALAGGLAVPEPSAFALVGLVLFTVRVRALGAFLLPGNFVAQLFSVSRLSIISALAIADADHLLVIAARIACAFCCLGSALCATFTPICRAQAGREFSLAPIDTLPNAPSTYSMRDWHQTAVNFDSLAFNTTATGQYTPIIRIDNTFQPPQTQTWYGLPSYVGETRTFGETGEPIHEAVASLAAVWGGTLVGVDKTAGPYNFVAIVASIIVDRNSNTSS